jgi:2,3-bisphosphoglycerate-dependent phosphoglycerate mutase
MYPVLRSGFTFIGRRLQNKSLLNLLSSFSTSGTVDNKERLIFVRHARTKFNPHTWAGWFNVDLTEEGEKQAEDLGRLLKKINFFPHIVYTTELRRAWITTDIMLKEMNWFPPVKKHHGLLEQHVGAFTGTLKTEEDKLIVKGPDSRPPAMDISHPYHHLNNPGTIGVPRNGLGSESRKDVIARAGEFYCEELLPQLKARKRLLVVAHSNSGKSLIQYIAGIAGITAENLNLVINNAEPIEVKFKRDKNDDPIFSHLVPILTPSTTINSNKVIAMSKKSDEIVKK